MVAAVLGDFFTRCVVVIVGMLFPGYKSFKAVKNSDVAGQQKWLHYWLVLSIVSTVMLVLEPVLYGRVPFYNMIKIAVVAVLVHPKTAGYEQIYNAVVQPFLDQHMATIDNKLDMLDKSTQEAAKNFVPTARKYALQAKDSVARQMQKPPKKTS